MFIMSFFFFLTVQDDYIKNLSLQLVLSFIKHQRCMTIAIGYTKKFNVNNRSFHSYSFVRGQYTVDRSVFSPLNEFEFNRLQESIFSVRNYSFGFNKL